MKMTWKKLLLMTAQGYGSGHGNDYKPFLRVTRRNTSKVSNQGVGSWLFGYTREFHYFARAERHIALALWWLGAKDIREQFPLWPVTHRHPLCGAAGAENMVLPHAIGLLDIAKCAGIDHGVFVGSKIPYVATMDLMTTVTRKRTVSLVAISCKPRELIAKAASDSRMLERLELERLYCQSINTPYHVVDIKVFNKTLIANLEWLSPSQQNVAALHSLASYGHFRDQLRRALNHTPIDRSIAAACQRLGWPLEQGHSAFRQLAWEQTIDIDLTEPVVMTETARQGGVKIRQALQQSLLGVIDDE